MADSYKSVGELFSESSKLVKRNLRLFIVLNAITIFNTAWSTGLVLRDKTNGTDWGTLLWHSVTGNPDYKMNATMSSIVTITGVILSLMLVILAVLATKQKTVDFKDVWQKFKVTWWKLILVVIVIILPILAGFLLLVIPGLYLVGRLAFAPYIVVDQNAGPLEAANKSFEMTKGRAWPVVLAVIFGLILNLPSIIPVLGPVISLILTIAYSCAVPIRYFEMKGKHHSEA
jgi:hypothetical protein